MSRIARLAEAKTALRKRMVTYLNGPATPREKQLRMLQDVHREMWLYRSLLAEGLYMCACGSVEGEHHAGECPVLLTGEHYVIRPREPAATVPVEIQEHIVSACEERANGCIYDALPGTKYCAVHARE